MRTNAFQLNVPRSYSRAIDRSRSLNGYILPVVMISMTSMLLLLMGLLTMVGLERDTSRAWSNKHQAKLAAESALAESKLIIAEVATNDYYQIIRSDLPSADDSGSSSSDLTPYYYAVQPSSGSGDAIIYRYHPLFSTNDAPAETAVIEAPDQLLLPTDSTQVLDEKAPLWQSSKSLV